MLKRQGNFKLALLTEFEMFRMGIQAFLCSYTRRSQRWARIDTLLIWFWVKNIKSFRDDSPFWMFPWECLCMLSFFWMLVNPKRGKKIPSWQAHTKLSQQLSNISGNCPQVLQQNFPVYFFSFVTRHLICYKILLNKDDPLPYAE